MVIYEYRPDFRRFSSLEFVDEQQSSLLIRLLYSDPESTRAYDCPMIRVRRATEGYMATEPNDLPFGDTPALMFGCIALSRRAMNALQPMLQLWGRFIPIVCEDCEGWDYRLLQVTKVIDALDQERTEIKRWPDGRVREPIRRPIFREDAVATAFAFQVPGYWGNVFLTDLFMQRVREAGLTGFDCPLVWPYSDAEERERFQAKRRMKQQQKKDRRQGPRT
jgi:hypothetical protein